jgi:sec-independent protein translocase protein TatC
MFLLPVLMTVLTRLSIVSHEQWLRHWRGALVAALLFSAVVTPDGSGVTMIFLFIPLIVLYGIGLVFSKKVR